MIKPMKVGLGCAALLLVFFLVTFGVMLGYVLHEQHLYKNLADTRD